AGPRLALRVAVDYSSRDAIVSAARRIAFRDSPTREGFAARLAEAQGGGGPDVDLMIRTGGEQRLSDFLLWESAYAELFFTGRMWPDFGGSDLSDAVAEFQRRERRLGAGPAGGGAPPAPAAAAAGPPAGGGGPAASPQS